jgi:hypothetical protein
LLPLLPSRMPLPHPSRCSKLSTSYSAFCPNLFRMVGNSPAALKGYLSLMGALGKGELSAQTRERIVLAVAEITVAGTEIDFPVVHAQKA